MVLSEFGLPIARSIFGEDGAPPSRPPEPVDEPDRGILGPDGSANGRPQGQVLTEREFVQQRVNAANSSQKQKQKEQGKRRLTIDPMKGPQTRAEEEQLAEDWANSADPFRQSMGKKIQREMRLGDAMEQAMQLRPPTKKDLLAADEDFAALAQQDPVAAEEQYQEFLSDHMEQVGDKIPFPDTESEYDELDELALYQSVENGQMQFFLKDDTSPVDIPVLSPAELEDIRQQARNFALIQGSPDEPYSAGGPFAAADEFGPPDPNAPQRPPTLADMVRSGRITRHHVPIVANEIKKTLGEMTSDEKNAYRNMIYGEKANIPLMNKALRWGAEGLFGYPKRALTGMGLWLKGLGLTDENVRTLDMPGPATEQERMLEYLDAVRQAKYFPDNETAQAILDPYGPQGTWQKIVNAATFSGGQMIASHAAAKLTGTGKAGMIAGMGASMTDSFHEQLLEAGFADNQQTAAVASSTGLVMGYIEYLQFGGISKSIKGKGVGGGLMARMGGWMGLKKASQDILAKASTEVGENMAKAAARGAVGETLGIAGAHAVGAVSMEMLEEGLQELAALSGKGLLDWMDENVELDWDEELWQSVDDLRIALPAVALMVLPGISVRTLGRGGQAVANRGKVQRAQEALDRLNEQVADVEGLFEQREAAARESQPTAEPLGPPPVEMAREAAREAETRSQAAAAQVAEADRRVQAARERYDRNREQYAQRGIKSEKQLDTSLKQAREDLKTLGILPSQFSEEALQTAAHERMSRDDNADPHAWKRVRDAYQRLAKRPMFVEIVAAENARQRAQNRLNEARSSGDETAIEEAENGLLAAQLQLSTLRRESIRPRASKQRGIGDDLDRATAALATLGIKPADYVPVELPRRAREAMQRAETPEQRERIADAVEVLRVDPDAPRVLAARAEHATRQAERDEAEENRQRARREWGRMQRRALKRTWRETEEQREPRPPEPRRPAPQKPPLADHVRRVRNRQKQAEPPAEPPTLPTVLRDGDLEYLKDGLRPDRMAHLEEVYADKDPTEAAMSEPPITIGVWPDGTYVLVDGRHRWLAAQRHGAKEIRAEFEIRAADTTLLDTTERVVAVAAESTQPTPQTPQGPAPTQRAAERTAPPKPPDTPTTPITPRREGALSQQQVGELLMTEPVDNAIEMKARSLLKGGNNRWAELDELKAAGQEAVLEGGGSYDPSKGDFQPWAAMVARSGMLRFLKRNAPDARGGEETETVEPATPSTVEEGIVGREEADLLERAFNQLSDQQATVMRRRAEGETQQQVADDMGVTRQRVGQIEAEARKLLRQVGEQAERRGGRSRLQANRELADRLRSRPELKGAQITPLDEYVEVITPSGDKLNVRYEDQGELDRIVARYKGRLDRQARLEGRPLPNRASGVYFNGRGEIVLARNARNKTIGHELVHAMRDLGLITDAEMQLFGGEEHLAHAYGKWIDSGMQDMAGGSIFRRILRNLSALLGGVHARQEKILMQIDRGRMWRRGKEHHRGGEGTSFEWSEVDSEMRRTAHRRETPQARMFDEMRDSWRELVRQDPELLSELDPDGQPIGLPISRLSPETQEWLPFLQENGMVEIHGDRVHMPESVSRFLPDHIKRLQDQQHSYGHFGGETSKVWEGPVSTDGTATRVEIRNVDGDWFVVESDVQDGTITRQQQGTRRDSYQQALRDYQETVNSIPMGDSPAFDTDPGVDGQWQATHPTERLPARAARWFRHMAGKSGVMPVTMYDADRTRERKIRTQAFLVEDAMERSVWAIGQVAKQEGIKPRSAREKYSSALNEVYRRQRPVEELPEAMQPVTRELMSARDTLEQGLIDQGILSDEQVAQHREYWGDYIHRAYDVFEDAKKHRKWLDSKAGQEVREDFDRWAREELGKTESEAEQFRVEMLNIAEKYSHPMHMLTGGSAIGGEAQNILKPRKGIPEPLRRLWGEKTDPLMNIASTIMQQAQLLHNHQFQRQIMQAGYGTFFHPRQTETPLGRFTVPLAQVPEARRGEGGEPVQPNQVLRGLVEQARIEAEARGDPSDTIYTSEELRDALLKANDPSTGGWVMRLMQNANAAAKIAHTAKNTGTQARNFLFNPMFLANQGVHPFNVSRHRQVARLMRHRLQLGTAAARAHPFRETSEQTEEAAIGAKMLRLGVWGEEHQTNAVREIIDKLGGETEFTKAVQSGDPAGWLKRAYRNTGTVTNDVLSLFYKMGDEYWKTYYFLTEHEAYRKAHPEWAENVDEEGLSMLDHHVGETVRRAMVTWSEIPQAGRALSKNFFMAPFASFPIGVWKTQVETYRMISEELHDPATRGIGYRRLAGTTVMTVPQVLNSFKGAGAVGVLAAPLVGAVMGPDDEEAFRKNLADWDKNARLIWLDRDGPVARYMNIDYSDPYSYTFAPLRAMMMGESPAEALGLAGYKLVEQFASPELFVAGLDEIRRNEHEKVYNPVAPWYDQLWSSTKYLWWNTLAPGYVRGTYDIYKGAKGETAPTKTYTTKDAALRMLGFSIHTVDTRQSLRFKGRNFLDHLGSAQREMIRTLRQPSYGVEDVEAAHARMERLRKQGWAELVEAIQSTKRTGASDLEIRQALDQSYDEYASSDPRGEVTAAPIGKARLRALMDGRYVPWKPSSSTAMGWGESGAEKRMKLAELAAKEMEGLPALQYLQEEYRILQRPFPTLEDVYEHGMTAAELRELHRTKVKNLIQLKEEAARLMPILARQLQKEG